MERDNHVINHLVEAIGIASDRVDERFDDAGPVAKLWAASKLGAIAGTAGAWAPAFALRASSNHQRAVQMMASFGDQLRAIAKGDPPSGPGNHVERLPAATRLLLVSDLHRCVPGSRDWPERQQTKDLYVAMLEHYAADGWHLCENGDVEDFWMVGGSTWGASYDALRIAGAAMSLVGFNDVRIAVYKEHLERIIENNQSIYDTIEDGFSGAQRYHRLIGNHDDVMRLPGVQETLRDHLGHIPIADYLALDGDDHRLVGVACHGHHTDGWNGPDRDWLGKVSTWMSGAMVDFPLIPAPEGLPPTTATIAATTAGLRNRLIEVHPFFGANTNYDSLDEEILFKGLRDDDLLDCWLFMGHTHSPVAGPTSRLGNRWERYFNSGSGVTPTMVTAIEWDGTDGEGDAQLVAWVLTSPDADGPGKIMGTVRGQDLRRIVLESDQDRLRPR